MGLFGKKKTKQQAQQMQQAEPPKMIYEAWQTAPYKGIYRLPPEHESRIYTYDGTPFKGLTVNTKLIVTAVPGNVEMTSIYTGTTTSTTDYDDVAYSYNNYIFGLSSSHSKAIKTLMQAGYRVEVEAYINGYDGMRGNPMIVGLFGYVDTDTFKEASKIIGVLNTN